mgnify:CR=1 FL=1
MAWRILWQSKKGMKLIANNKKAFHDYFIEDTYEAGIDPCRNRSKIPAYGQNAASRNPLSV